MYEDQYEEDMGEMQYPPQQPKRPQYAANPGPNYYPPNPQQEDLKQRYEDWGFQVEPDAVKMQ